MTAHRMLNLALLVFGVVAWAFAMDAERRAWAQAVAHCHRAFGPQTAPEYDHNDVLVCVSRKGVRLAAVAQIAGGAGK